LQKTPSCDNNCKQVIVVARNYTDAKLHMLLWTNNFAWQISTSMEFSFEFFYSFGATAYTDRRATAK